MPAWFSASPKYLKTRPVKTWLMTIAQKRAISPRDSSHARGTVSQPVAIYLIVWRSGLVASMVWVKT